MPVESSPDRNKLFLKHPKVGPIQRCCDIIILLTLSQGSSAEILLFGATVISWKSPSTTTSVPTERLFVSSKSSLDGSKAVRGGIPVVFPFFGAPTKPEHSKLPQHGFARNHVWSWDGGAVMDNEAGVSVRLSAFHTKSRFPFMWIDANVLCSSDTQYIPHRRPRSSFLRRHPRRTSTQHQHSCNKYFCVPSLETPRIPSPTAHILPRPRAFSTHLESQRPHLHR